MMGATTPSRVISLAKTINAKDVFVIANSSATDQNIVTQADDDLSIKFDGNDVVGLFKISNNRFVDYFGILGDNPMFGGWQDNQGIIITADAALIRNPDVLAGHLDSSVFNADQWTFKVVSDLELGFHNNNCSSCTSIVNQIDSTICLGDSILILGTYVKNSAFIAIDTTQTSNGCDSITAIKVLIDSSCNQAVQLPCSRLFFSEYIEGSGNNKAIEIYNPTSDTIDLYDYEISLYRNGSPIISASHILSGLLAPNDVYVLANPRANSIILNQADETWGSLTFNGDDALVLSKFARKIDIFGETGVDPGTGWPDAFGDPSATVDATLIRRFNTQYPRDTNGTFFTTAEWESKAKDDFSNLGQHASICVASCSSDTTILNESICQGDSFVYNGKAYSFTGKFVIDTFTSITGCDSILILDLGVFLNGPACITSQPCSEIFISEYVEGTGNNQALEYYNPTQQDIDLRDYELQIFKDTATSPYLVYTFLNTIQSEGTFVIGNAQADQDILSAADELDSAFTFDGDDYIVLFNVTNGQIIDEIGTVNFPTNGGWEDATGTVVTRNITLLRDETFTQYSGWDADGWYTEALDDFADLGFHESDCESCVDNTVIKDTICLGDTVFFAGQTFTSAGSYPIDTIINPGKCDSATILEVSFKQSCSELPCDEIFFSEYYEAGGNDQAIEIYNPTNRIIDLSHYRLNVYKYGDLLPTNSRFLQGVIGPGEAYVVANSAADISLVSVSDELWDSLNYDGNDVIHLYSIVTFDVVDRIGFLGTLPNLGWSDTNGVVITKNKNLLRKQTVQSGGVFNPSEWDVNSALTPFDFQVHKSDCEECVRVYDMNETICVGDTFDYSGLTYTQEGTYRVDSMISADGLCDSLVLLHLTVQPFFSNIAEYDTICSGDSVYFFGNYVSRNGIHMDTLTSVLGCDSLVLLELFIDTTSNCGGPIQQAPCSDLIISEYYQGQGNDQAIEIYNPTSNRIDLLNYELRMFEDGSVIPTQTFRFFDFVDPGQTFIVVNGAADPSLQAVADDFRDSLNFDGNDAIVLYSLTDQANIDEIGFIGDNPINGGWEDSLGTVITLDQILVRKPAVQQGGSFKAAEWAVFRAIQPFDLGFHTSDCGGCINILDLYETVCEGDTLDFAGNKYFAAGVYTIDSLKASDGICDSLTLLTITIDSLITTTIFDTICAGDSVIYAGQKYDSEGVFPIQDTNANGCTILTILEITVDTNCNTNCVNTVDTINQAICFGDTIYFGNDTITQAGAYSDTFVVAGGCDSAVTLNVRTTTILGQTVFDTICPGDTAYLGLNKYVQSGTYSDTFQSINGCDSLVTLNLFVDSANPNCTFSFPCSGLYISEYLEGSQMNKAIEIYNASDAMINLSNYTLNIYSNGSNTNPSVIQLTGNLDSNKRFVIANSNANPSITNLANTTSGALDFDGDDAITLESGSQIVDIFGKIGEQPANGGWLGNSTAIWTKDHTLRRKQSVTNGVALNPITFDPTQEWDLFGVNEFDDLGEHRGICHICRPTVGVDTAFICSGDTIQFNGRILSRTGVYFDTIMNVDGCDSILIKVLVKFPPKRERTERTICNGDTVQFRGQVYSAPGVYTDSLLTSGGCDSLIILTLNVDSGSITNDTITICQGDSVELDGAYYNTTGVYTATIANANGCDSTVTIDLTVTPAFADSTSDIICKGDTIWFNGTPLTDSGVYQETFTTASGCDSLVVFELSVLPISTSPVIFDTICQGDIVVFRGKSYTESGTYYDTLSSANGCDSLVQLDLFVNPAPTTYLFDTVCSGDSVLFNGVYYSLPGTYSDTINTGGCDSIVVFQLDSITGVLTPRVTIASNYPGICDTSTVFYTSTVSNAGTSASYIWYLNGDSVGNTVDITLNNIYLDDTVWLEVTSSTSCGPTSAVASNQVILVAGQVVSNVIPFNICDGDSLIYQGKVYKTSGIFDVDTTKLANGCDSITRIDVFLNPNTVDSISNAICLGDSILFEGKYYSTPGRYVENLATVYGCDSTRILNLTLNTGTAQPVTIYDTICDGDSYQFGSRTLTTSGTYYDTLGNNAGCDSVAILELQVSPAPVVVANVDDTLILKGQTVNFTPNGSSATTYNWDFGDGFQSSLISVSHTYNSIGTFTATLTAGFGDCIDSAKVTIRVLPDTTIGVEEYDLSKHISIYPNPTSDILNMSFNLKSRDNVIYTILSAEGKSIVAGRIDALNTVATINLPAINSGIYFVRFEANDQIITKRLVILK